jgi:methionine sulfoxide reductase heme-binding subunit
MHQNAITTARSLLFLASIVPLGWLAWLVGTDTLGADPAETVQRYTGIWTLNFLLLTLCISPLRALTGQHWLLRLRRMFGLFTFTYACVHFLSFIGFTHDFSLHAIARDVLKRPFISIGFAAFVLLIPLALTSNALAIRQLGGKKWQELHRSIYLIAILACLHYLWQSKLSELAQPLAYAVVTGLLLWWRVQNRKQRSIAAPPTQRVQAVKFFKKRPD